MGDKVTSLMIEREMLLKRIDTQASLVRAMRSAITRLRDERGALTAQIRLMAGKIDGLQRLLDQYSHGHVPPPDTLDEEEERRRVCQLYDIYLPNKG